MTYRWGGGGQPLRTSAVILLVLLAACGSTVDAPSDSPGPGAPDESAAVRLAPTADADDSPPPPASDVGDEPLSAPPTTAAGSPPAGLTTPRSPTLPSEARAPARCPIPVRPGTPGITDADITLGAPRPENPDRLAAALGVQPPEREAHEYVEAMVEHINATGGVACRRIQLVWHEVDLADSYADANVQEQAMCATWTQDHPVFAAFTGVWNSSWPVLYPCLDRAGVTIIDILGTSYRDAQGFAEVPRLLAVNAVRLDRGAAAQIHALVRQGFLTAESRIGVAYYDEPNFVRTVDGKVIPALAEHGLTLTERRVVTYPARNADPDRERDIANAVLRFKLADIDRVLFVRGPGLASGFMRAAERSRYRPRYGLAGAELEGASVLAPEAQLVGARGIGWYPDADLYPRHPEPWPARSACLEFFAERGFRTATRWDRAYAVSVCEGLWFLQAAVEAAPQPLSADAVVAGAAALGSGYESPTVRWTRLAADRPDGAAMYHDVAYDRGCGCFVYTSRPHALP